ncbi:MAG: hypothetical protein DUD27_01575 [Lachnospiraceae bacterium]|nr:MAG: hypothetical protein DUD27_01575 [Lachnospiraceae bacterium]
MKVGSLAARMDELLKVRSRVQMDELLLRIFLFSRARLFAAFWPMYGFDAFMVLAGGHPGRS